MSQEGILSRGKANYEAGAFMDNPETLAYIDSLKVEEVEEKPKKKEKKNASR